MLARLSELDVFHSFKHRGVFSICWLLYSRGLRPFTVHTVKGSSTLTSLNVIEWFTTAYTEHSQFDRATLVVLFTACFDPLSTPSNSEEASSKLIMPLLAPLAPDYIAPVSASTRILRTPSNTEE